MKSSSFSIFSSSDLKKRLIFVLFALVIYRFGCYVTLPGIDSHYINSLFQDSVGSGFLGMFNLFSGGALGRMTVFALNIMPYIVSSIIIQVSVSTLKNEGKLSDDVSSKKISFYSRIATVLLSIVQGSIIVIGLQKTGAFIDTGKGSSELILMIIAIFTLVGGTIFLVWLGDQITSRGIGNGISLIIFSGIASEIPSSFASVLSLSKFGDGSLIKIFFVLLLVFGTLLLIVICERSYRCIDVIYPRRQIRNKMYNNSSSHIPIKINMSGVIPPIFANAILLFPLTIANFNKDSVFGELILRHFTPGQPVYIVIYIAMIVFFCFFYSDFVFNSKDIAENLKKNGGIVVGNRPGSATMNYMSGVVKRLTVIGAVYLSIVCVVPEFIRSYYYIPFAIGGTSLLIMVNVVIELFSQLQTHIFSNQYSNLLKKNSF